MSQPIALGEYVTAQWDVMSGSPCIIGRRIRTKDVTGWFLGGMGLEKIAIGWKIPIAHVEDAVRYEMLRCISRGPEFRAEKP